MKINEYLIKFIVSVLLKVSFVVIIINKESTVVFRGTALQNTTNDYLSVFIHIDQQIEPP